MSILGDVFSTFYEFGSEVVGDTSNLVKDITEIVVEDTKENIEDLWLDISIKGDAIIDTCSDISGDFTDFVKEAGDDFIDLCSENPVLIGTLVGIPFSYLAAPKIAVMLAKAGLLGKTATTGAEIMKLHGIAQQNAALAKLGWGAKSVGGLGIKGGKVAISTNGGLLSGGATKKSTSEKHDT